MNMPMLRRAALEGKHAYLLSSMHNGVPATEVDLVDALTYNVQDLLAEGDPHKATPYTALLTIRNLDLASVLQQGLLFQQSKSGSGCRR